MKISSAEPDNFLIVENSKELSKQLQVVLDSIHDGIGFFDYLGNITYINNAFTCITGISPKSIVNHNIQEFILEKELNEILTSSEDLIELIQINNMSLVVAIKPIIVDGNTASTAFIIQTSSETHEVKDTLKILKATVKDKEFSCCPDRCMVDYAFQNFIGLNEKVLEVLKIAAKASKVRSTVLICGKSGTGKELIAEGIHHSSARQENPFIKINCAAIPSGLLESELFGHEKGAFTGAVKRKLGKFELANTGTLFLDEIGEMDLSMQTKLLRVLQNNSFERVGGEETIKTDVRILAATNQNMEQMVKEGKFREDLYYRLNVIPIYLPELQDRKDDIPLLVNHFFNKYNNEFNKQLKGITQVAIDILTNYQWPGNVRELKNIVERMVALTDSPYIDSSDIPCYIKQKITDENELDKLYGSITKGNIFPLEHYEKQIIKAALTKHGSYTAAAKVLGITHKTVAAKAQKYGLIHDIMNG